MPAKSLFILGTGFIGGSVLAALLEKKDQYSIAALCRDPKKADQLKELGVRPVQGELASDELIAKEAAEADVSSSYLLSSPSDPPDPAQQSCLAALPLRTCTLLHSRADARRTRPADHHAHRDGRRPAVGQEHPQGPRLALVVQAARGLHPHERDGRAHRPAALDRRRLHRQGPADARQGDPRPRAAPRDRPRHQACSREQGAQRQDLDRAFLSLALSLSLSLSLCRPRSRSS